MQATFWWSRGRPTPDKAKPKLRFSERWTPAKKRSNNSRMREKDNNDKLTFRMLAVTIAIQFVLVSISVGIPFHTSYNEHIDDSANAVAHERLQYLSAAIQRYEMKNKCGYPHNKLNPLEGKFVRHLTPDPWGCEYGIDGERGIVYSSGGCRCSWQKVTTWFGTNESVTTSPVSIPPSFEDICEEHRIYVCYRAKP